MSTLMQQIQDDLVKAMKNKEEVRLSVLRMLKASMQMMQVEKGKDSTLTDDEVMVLLRRLIKQRNEAAEMYKNGGAEDRAQNELDEAKILEAYLPAQLSDVQLREIVANVAKEVGAQSVRDMGKVMGKAMSAVAGQADGNRVKAIVQDHLNSLS
ncbi:GatB/YqeY domain-containing protein [Synergistaceae bacterium OttesenSCG-928-D05]|nr:GatB/YqeY domain-containing protein [Synergistaceae bacterium OttesenSCG-928-D05]